MVALRLPVAVVVAGLVMFACTGGGGVGLDGLDLVAPPDGVGVDGADDSPGLDAGPDRFATHPRLVVSPSDLDFEWVFLGQAATLPLTLSNEGVLTLALQPPGVVFATTPFVSLPDAPETLFSIVPGGSTVVTVRFAPTALFPPRNEPIAFIRLVSNDPEAHEIDVPIFGRTTTETAPQVHVEPATLDLGSIALGSLTEESVTLSNDGDRELRVSSVAIELPDLLFSVVADPWFPPTLAVPIDAGIQPGDQKVLRVRFDARFADLEPGPVQATLVITSDDPRQPKLGVLLQGEVLAQGDCPLTLEAPSPLDLGTVTVGCHGPSRTVRLTNLSGAPATIHDVTVKESCGSLFPLLGVSAFPLQVAPYAQAFFQLRFDPLIAGVATCLATVRVAQCEDRYLGLVGTGSLISTAVETFQQRASPVVDVLLVVDESGSMAPVLSRLADAAPALLQALEGSHADYHVGLISASTDPACPNAATLLTTPRIVTEADAAALAAAIEGLSGSACDPSGHESGFEAMRLALTAPKITDQGVSCATPAECAAPYGCVAGGCGGPNRGFLRPEAMLRVLFVSDEDDQSEAPLDLYLAFLDVLKGPLDTERVDAFAAVGELPSGCTDGVVMASPGARYLQAVEATGGAASSVCEADFSALLATLGTVQAPFAWAFPLAAEAEPATLHVRIDGVACDDGWWYEPVWHEVVFDPEGPCLPPSGSTITVSYERLCLTD